MQTLSEKDVAKIALLSRLKLHEGEAAQISGQLSKILAYVEQLAEVDTADVEPLAHPLELANVFRDDEVKPSLPVEEALANAGKRVGDFYSVPPILEDRH